MIFLANKILNNQLGLFYHILSNYGKKGIGEIDLKGQGGLQGLTPVTCMQLGNCMSIEVERINKKWGVKRQ
ncbi:hypothetical protein CWR48_02790 [Oceanobacillus arenosus]|uniref:Uncharacterized protein n=1 Tax=Oceanobacillus arenosus TaxID=1229153 RepID=A0A3D8PZE8_9BACI|nr:hypothetical protein CWR48_02790 [Oceanobacillus arenosus]